MDSFEILTSFELIHINVSLEELTFLIPAASKRLAYLIPMPGIAVITLFEMIFSIIFASDKPTCLYAAACPTDSVPTLLLQSRAKKC